MRWLVVCLLLLPCVSAIGISGNIGGSVVLQDTREASWTYYLGISDASNRLNVVVDSPIKEYVSVVLTNKSARSYRADVRLSLPESFPAGFYGLDFVFQEVPQNLGGLFIIVTSVGDSKRVVAVAERAFPAVYFDKPTFLSVQNIGRHDLKDARVFAHLVQDGREFGAFESDSFSLGPLRSSRFFLDLPFHELVMGSYDIVGSVSYGRGESVAFGRSFDNGVPGVVVSAEPVSSAASVLRLDVVLDWNVPVEVDSLLLQVLDGGRVVFSDMIVNATVLDVGSNVLDFSGSFNVRTSGNYSAVLSYMYGVERFDESFVVPVVVPFVPPVVEIPKKKFSFALSDNMKVLCIAMLSMLFGACAVMAFQEKK